MYFLLSFAPWPIQLRKTKCNQQGCLRRRVDFIGDGNNDQGLAAALGQNPEGSSRASSSTASDFDAGLE